MGLRRFLTAALLLRRSLRALEAIASELHLQRVLLARLADHWAPEPPAVDLKGVRADTGVSFLDPTEAALADAYVDRQRADNGYVPNEDEIATFLADEKTIALHERLVARDLEVERTLSARRGELP